MGAYIEATKKLIDMNGLESTGYDAHACVLHSSPASTPGLVVLLTSDKRFDFGAGGSETWPAWRMLRISSRKGSQCETRR